MKIGTQNWILRLKILKKSFPFYHLEMDGKKGLPALKIVLTHQYHHHHHIALVARISLTLSRHSSLSFIALGRSSGQHPVSSHSCWIYVCAGRPAFARPCVGVHKSTSLMSSSLLLQQCPACLARLTWIVFVIGGRWPYSWCLVGCCRQDLFKIARSILTLTSTLIFSSFSLLAFRFHVFKLTNPQMLSTFKLHSRIHTDIFKAISWTPCQLGL